MAEGLVNVNRIVGATKHAFPVVAGGTLPSVPGVVLSSQVTSQTAASTAYYHPWVVLHRIVVTALYARVATAGTAGATARLSIYKADVDWQPTLLLKDAGTIAVDSTNIKSITGLSVALGPGLYLARLHADASATQPIYTSYRGSPYTGSVMIDAGTTIVFAQEMSVGVAYAAAESPGTDWDSNSTGTSPFIYKMFAAWTPAGGA